MIATVHVGVSLRRPPRLDEWRHIVVQADNPIDGMLLATQIAACTSVMPVEACLIRAESDSGYILRMARTRTQLIEALVHAKEKVVDAKQQLEQGATPHRRSALAIAEHDVAAVARVLARMDSR